MNGNFIIAGRTDVGQARQVNEDSMVAFDSPNGRVIAVCDGMGGMAAGDVASKLACNIITDILTDNKFGTPTEGITKAIMAANQGILYKASQNPEMSGMGATCVIVIIKDGMVYYGWVGDSRIYYINDHKITMLTRDQSFVQQMVNSGQMTSKEAEDHPLKNEITNAMGLETMTPPELCTTPLSPAPGSVILLCSDGLSGMVDNATICQVASDNRVPLQERADRLVNIANSNGGTDNITVQMIEFEGGRGAGYASPRPSESSGRRNGWMIWAAIFVGLLILAGGAWYIFFTDDEKPKEPKEMVNDMKMDDEDSDNDININNTSTGTESSSKEKQNGGKKYQQKNGITPSYQTPNPKAPGKASTDKGAKQNTPSKPKSNTGSKPIDNIQGVKKPNSNSQSTTTPKPTTTKPETTPSSNNPKPTKPGSNQGTGIITGKD